MPLWLYALTATPLPARPPAGAAGEALQVWAVSPAAGRAGGPGSPPASGAGAAGAGGLHVIAGEMAAPLRPSEAALRAHDRTVRALADLLDPLLPVRFGQTVASVDELTALLAPRHAALLAALDEVSGCVQVTLRFPAAGPRDEPAPGDPDLATPAAPPDEPAAPTGPGARYLHSRRAAVLAAAVPPPAARPLLARLAPLVRAERVAPGRPPYAATVYHLVPRRRLDEYGAALAAAAAALDPPPVASGPWPAWAFAPGLVE